MRKTYTQPFRGLGYLIICLAIIFVFIDFSGHAQIQSVQSGNWSSPSTWAGGVVPTAADDVAITANHTITVDVPVVINHLTMSNGTLQGNQSFTVNGNMTMSNGIVSLLGEIIIAENLIMSGGQIGSGNSSSQITVTGDYTFSGGTIGGSIQTTGTLTVNGNTLIEGSAVKTIYGKTLLINGSGNWNAGALYIGSNGKMEIGTGKILVVDLASAKSVSNNYGYNATLTNNGTLELNGNSTFTLSIPFINNGAVNISGVELKLSTTNNQQDYGYYLANGSTLNFYDGTTNGLNGNNVSHSGDWTLKLTGATVNLSGGTFNITNYHQSAGILQGSADINIMNDVTIPGGSYNVIGTTTCNGNVTVSGGTFDGGSGTRNIAISGNLILSSGSISSAQGSSQISVNGNFNFSGGYVGYNPSTGALTVNGTTTLESNTAKTIWGKTLILNGGGTWSAGALYVGNNGKMEVSPGSTFNIDLSSAKSITNNYGNSATFVNNGTLQLNGSSTLTIGIVFNHSGTVNISGGELKLSTTNNQQNYGYYLDNGSTLNFYDGTTNGLNGNNVSHSGDWTLKLTGATVNLSGGTFNITNYHQSAGILQGSADINIMNDVTIPGGSYNVIGTTTCNGNVTVSGGTFDGGTGTRNIAISGNLILSSGSISSAQGSSQISVNGNFNFSGGYVGYNPSTGALTVNGTTTIESNAAKTIWGKTLILNGGGTWSAGALYVGNNGKMEVGPGSTFNIDLSSAKSITNNYGNSATFVNNGTLQLNGSSTLTIGIVFNHSGTVNISGGELKLSSTNNQQDYGYYLANGSTLNFYDGTTNGLNGNNVGHSGDWTLKLTGATVNLSGGTFNITNYHQSAGILQGSADINIMNDVTIPGGSYNVIGTTTCNGNVTVSGGTFDGGTGTRNIAISGNLILSSGSISSAQGSSQISVNGNFNFSGGYVGYNPSTGALTVNGTTTIESNAAKTIWGKTLILNGGGTWSAGALYVGNNGKMEVGPGSTFNIDLSSAKSITNNYGNSATLVNNGTLQLNGSSTLTIGIVFNHSGTVNISGGELKLSSTNNQQDYGYYLANGSTLNFYDGTTNGLNGNNVNSTGDWTLKITGATVNLTGGILNITNYHQSAGIFQGSADINIINDITIPGGSYNVIGTTTCEGNVTVNGGAFDAGTVTGTRNINIYGNLIQSSGYISSAPGSSQITVNGDYTFTGGYVGYYVSTGALTINGNTIIESNAAKTIWGKTLILNGGGTWSAGALNIGNNGKLEVGTGDTLSVDLSSAKAISNNYGNSATLVNNGTLLLNGSSTFSLSISFINNGIYINHTGNSTLSQPINNTGTLKGIGTLNFTSTLTQSGTISPGLSPGILTVNGAQPLSATSTLEIEMNNGSGAGSGHSQLQRSGNLTLNGKLRVIETGGVPNGTYIIVSLTSGTITGNFTTVELPGGYSYNVTATSVSVTKNVYSIACPTSRIVTAPAGQCSMAVSHIDAAVPGNEPYTYTLTGATSGNGSGTASGLSFNSGITTVTYALESNPAENCTFTVTVNTNVVPAVSIVASTNDICVGNVVTFTASPVNGGIPSYQWKVNGNPVGENSPVLNINTLNNGDTVSVDMTSSLFCATPLTVSSNSIIVTVIEPTAPVVTITSSSGQICEGGSVTFTAVPEYGGSAPAYQWKVNGENTGSNSPNFTSTGLNNGDTVSVVMTSSYPCATPTTALSNEIIMTVLLWTSPSVTITSSETEICYGTNVTFTATPGVGGNHTYQWKRNNSNVGSNSPVFQTTTLQNNDQVYVLISSDLPCMQNPAPSNTITMTVNPLPVVTITGADQFCEGASTTLTASQGVSYLWNTGATNQSITVTEPGTYSVTVTDIKGCQGTGSKVVKPVPLPVENFTLQVPADSSFSVVDPVFFSWTPSAQATFYDLYIWRTNQTKPATPTVTGITATSHTYTPYLNKNFIYNWQIVARNLCYQVESPVRLFAFNVFSDLTVSEVEAPSTGMTGQALPVTYTVANTGTGGTGIIPWKDDIYLSPSPDFDQATAIKMATVNNLSALNPGQQYNNTVNLIIPENMEGTWYPFVRTDINNIIQEIDENNNQTGSGSGITISFPPYPDLAVSNIQPVSGNIIPGETFTLGWNVENIGNAMASGGWSQRVSIVSGSQIQILGFVQNSDDLESGGIVSQSGSFLVPQHPGMDGDIYIEVRLIPNPELIENPNGTANNTALSANSVLFEKRLTITINPTSIPENSASPVQGMIYRSGNRSGALTVSFSALPDGRISFPASVTIPANQSGAQFSVSSIDNQLMEGNITVDLEAQAESYPASGISLTIIENEIPSFAFTLSNTTATEGDTVQLTVTRGEPLGDALNVSLFTSKASQIVLPSQITVEAGETSASLNIVVTENTTPELNEEVAINASAVGYVPVSDTLTVEDDDVPQINLTLNPLTVSEASGPYASFGYVQLPQPAATTLVVKLSTDQPNLVYFPAQVTIPAGQIARQFNVGVVDNGLLDGDKTAQITASVFINSCGCGAPSGTAGSSTQTLTIIDNDGPSLSVSSSPLIVPENLMNAGMITITRNTLGGPELAVSIQHNGVDEIDIPATAIIPEGAISVQVPFNTINDTIEDGDQVVTVMVTSQEYSSGACWIIVSDRNVPDYVAYGLNLTQSSMLINSDIGINLKVRNDGFSLGTNGAMVKIYKSSNTSIDPGDVLLSTLYTSEALQVGDSVEISTSVNISDAIGNYYIIANVNEGGSLNELININNTTEAVPLSVLPDYNAMAYVEGDVFNGTTPITITGVTEAAAKSPAPNKAVDVYVVVNGAKRILNAMSDINGEFSVNFTPLHGEAGEYYVGACYPGQGLNEAQDEFTILGARHLATGYILWDMYIGETRSYLLDIQNFSPIPLNNVRIQVLSAPPGCTVNFSPIAQLDGNGLGTFSYSVSASTITSGTAYQEVKLQLVSDEGTKYRFSAWFYSRATRGNLKLTPVSLSKGMVRGSLNYSEFEILNNGNDSTGQITILLPQNNWMSLATESNIIPSLLPGETADVTLRLLPGNDLQLNNPITGQIALVAPNANSAALPFTFEPVSTATGSLVVDVVDEYTYNTEAEPHLAGASVTVSHPYTGQVIAQGITDANGLFQVAAINEGYYNLRVTANRHGSYQNIIYVDKGIQNNEVVFIPFQAITYTWQVVPTQILDEYEITLVTVFETNVPAPVVTMNMPDTMPELNQGQVFPFVVTLTNHGLITAQDVELTFPEDAEYMFTANVNMIDVMPNTSIQIPAIMERKPSFSPSKATERCADFVKASYKFSCGPSNQTRLVQDEIAYKGRICVDGGGGIGGTLNYYENDICYDCGGSSSPGSAPNNGGGGSNYFPIQIATVPLKMDNRGCNPCLLDFVNALWGCSPIPQELFTVDFQGKESYSPFDNVLEFFEDIDVEIPKPVKKVLEELDCAFKIGESFGCEINRMLQGILPEKSAIPAEILQANKDIYMASKGIQAMKDIFIEVFNSEEMVARQDFDILIDSILPNLNALSPIDTVQENQILVALIDSDITADEISSFIDRWNLTQEAWGLGVYSPNQEFPEIIDTLIIHNYLIQYDSAFTYAKIRGFDYVEELYNAAYEFAQDHTEETSNSVCATVTVQFSQRLTMTREAFEGTLTIFNGHETDAMQNVRLELEVRDENGFIRNDLFQINTKSLSVLSGIDGSGTLDAQATGSAVILFIPERGAAPDVPKYYSFGGKLSYLDPFTGEMYETLLFPVTLQVNPSPNLYIDYFMQRDILGDDALTEPIEPSIPAELAVMINNQGAGTAYSVNIESAQPTIIENEKGLLIDFEITGSNLGGKPTQLGLLNVSFGDIPGGDIAVGQWWFTSTLLGHFIAYEVSVNHLNSFGNPDLSLVSSVEIHELIKSVSVYGTLYDTINDFLVNDIPDSDDLPDALYHSTGNVSPVYLAEDIETDGPVRLDHLSVELTVTSSQPGWNYARMDDPGDGFYRIVSCTRDDGQVIPLDNIWLTYVTIPDGGEPIYENKLHFLDLFDPAGEQVYTVVFEPVNLDVPRVVRITGVPTAPANTPVTDVQVVFNKPIDPLTFSHDDMVLKNLAGPNLSDSTVIVSQMNDTTFYVDISSKTAPNGYYTLTVQAAGIADLIGNTGQTGMQVSWIQAISAPAIDYFFGLPEDAGAPIDTLLVLFNMPIVPSTFTVNQLILTDGNGNVIPTGNLLITPKSFNNVLFKISGLASITSGNGTYSLTFRVSEIMGESGQSGVADQTAQWSVCTAIPPVVDAGNDDILCIGASYPLNGTVLHSDTYLWTTTGTGTFDNNQSLNALYTPGAQDLIFGKVILTLTAQPLDPCVPAVSSDIELTIKNSVEANAGIDSRICVNKTFSLTGSVINASGYYWITSGDGSFSDTNILNPVYAPGVQDKAVGLVKLSLVATPTEPCTINDTASMFLTIQKSPSVYAGANQTVCQTAQVQLNANAQNYSSLVWSKSLSDGFLNDRTILNPVYSFGPNDLVRGIVILTLYAQAINPCFAPVSSTVRIFVKKNPVVNIGPNEMTCNSISYQLNATVQNSVSYIWAASGDGTFNNTNTLNPVYTFGSGDLQSGSVLFSLTAQSTAPCTGQVTASKTITIQQLPTVNAGEDVLICEGESFQLNGTVQNAASILWQSLGDGIFSDPTILNPVYYPGPQDIQNGNAAFRMMANPLSPCLDPAIDSVDIDIMALPDVFAGGDADICHTEIMQLEGSITGSGEIAWTSEGDGQFFLTNVLSTVYYPGSNDIMNGTVKLILKVTTLDPCPGEVTDTLILTINTCQELNLPSGWSGISSFVDPLNSQLSDLMSPVVDDLIILYSQTGIFWPGENVNTIGQWNRDDGYVVKVANELQLTIPGTRSAIRTLQLSPGWNLIPVHSECDAEVVSLFAGTNVVLVKDVAGWNLYWPSLNINTLGSLEPGKSYYVLMSESGSITFPDCQQGNMNSGQSPGNLKMGEIMDGSPWSGLNRTPYSHITGIPATAFDPGIIQPDDYIGVFDAEGLCFGMINWDGQNTSIVAFGDDQTTSEKDGFTDGETMYFKLYGSTTKVQYDLAVVYDPEWPQSDGTFTTNGISAITGFILNPTGISESGAMDVMIYPNPADQELFIDFHEITETTAIIVDVKGVEVLTQTLTELRNRLDISVLRNGIYFLKLENKGLIRIEKIVIR